MLERFFLICRTHVITQASTVRQEKRLPMTEGMRIEDLADLQIRQLVKHKSSLEGWERVSTDLYALNVGRMVMYSTYIPTEADVGHKLKVEVSSLKTRLIAIQKESEPVIERMWHYSF